MALRFLLDEHLRGRFADAIEQHNAQGGLPIDVVCVGDSTDLPLGSDDPDILLWAETNDRILITRDVNTIPAHLAVHIAAGHESPGVLIVSVKYSISELIAHLELVAHAGIAEEYANSIAFIP